MKRFFLFLLPIVAVTMVSCINLVENPSSTPTLQIGGIIVRSNLAGVRDTLTNFKDSTISVGDTLRVEMHVSGVLNNLTSVEAKADTSKVKVSLAWNEKDKDFLTSDAKPENGLLTFKPKTVVSIGTTLTYIPRKAGDYKISITVTSDALPEHSPRTWSFETTAK